MTNGEREISHTLDSRKFGQAWCKRDVFPCCVGSDGSSFAAKRVDLLIVRSARNIESWREKEEGLYFRQ